MIASPCNKCCQIGKTTGLCLGCYRSIEEIIAWNRADDQAKSLILAAVAERRRHLENAPGSG
ncbi:MAG: DUF1289 domain-containing protein [Sterolibacterium sp.]